MNILNKIEHDCSEIEKLLEREPSLVLCERELQILLQQRLLASFPEEVNFSLAASTIRPSGLIKSQMKTNRVFRELNLLPSLGRQSPKPDITIIENRDQIVLGKGNGAPSSFTPPFSCIIETKVSIDWNDVLSSTSSKKKNNRTLIIKDIEKYRKKNLLTGKVSKHFIFIVLTHNPELYEDLSDSQVSVICIKYPKKFNLEKSPKNSDDFDYINCIAQVIEEMNQLNIKLPLSMLREKDFETNFVTLLRQKNIPYVPVKGTDEKIAGYINPVRSQWATRNDGTRSQNRIHDIVILKNPLRLSSWGPSQRFLPIFAEFELKMSNSNSHNWFVKKPLKKELAYMTDLIKSKDLQQGYFIMFRYGSARWSDDAAKLKLEFNQLQHYYLPSHT